MNAHYVEEQLNEIYNDPEYSDVVKIGIKIMLKKERMRREFSANRIGLDIKNDITEKCLIFTDK
ncbi:MAG: hypothetical protein ACWGNI_00285 [Desulfobacterales bacterium]